MTYNEPILVAVDGSRGSSAAIRFAAHEARRLDTSLHLVHVVPNFVPMTPMFPLVPSDLEGAGRAILRRAAEEARELHPPGRISTSLLDGSRVPALVQAARNARLVALGHERHATIDRLLTGSTVTGVASAAACPVVAVHPDWVAGEERHCVLVGIKSTTDSHQLLRRAFESAAERGARLLIVHAWELPQEYDDLITSRVDETGWQDRAGHAIERSMVSFQEAYPEVRVEVRVRHGQPAHILEQASSEADVVILARRARAFPVGHLGGTARAVLRHSSCPVAIVPPADGPDEPLNLVLEDAGAIQK